MGAAPSQLADDDVRMLMASSGCKSLLIADGYQAVVLQLTDTETEDRVLVYVCWLLCSLLTISASDFVHGSHRQSGQNALQEVLKRTLLAHFRNYCRIANSLARLDTVSASFAVL